MLNCQKVIELHCWFAAVLHRKHRWVRIRYGSDTTWCHPYHRSVAHPRRQLHRRVCIQLAKPSFSQSWSHHSIVPKFPHLEKFRPRKESKKSMRTNPQRATRNQPMSSRFSVAHLRHLQQLSGWWNSIHPTRLWMPQKVKHRKNYTIWLFNIAMENPI